MGVLGVGAGSCRSRFASLREPGPGDTSRGPAAAPGRSRAGSASEGRRGPSRRAKYPLGVERLRHPYPTSGRSVGGGVVYCVAGLRFYVVRSSSSSIASEAVEVRRSSSREAAQVPGPASAAPRAAGRSLLALELAARYAASTERKAAGWPCASRARRRSGRAVRPGPASRAPWRAARPAGGAGAAGPGPSCPGPAGAPRRPPRCPPRPRSSCALRHTPARPAPPRRGPVGRPTERPPQPPVVVDGAGRESRWLRRLRSNRLETA